MKIIKQTSATVVSQQFDNSCFMTIEIPLSNYESIKTHILGIDGVTECS